MSQGPRHCLAQTSGGASSGMRFAAAFAGALLRGETNAVEQCLLSAQPVMKRIAHRSPFKIDLIGDFCLS
jgi:hypothetical protein